MNTHQDWAFPGPPEIRPLRSPPFPIDQKIITTIALLVLGYYALSLLDLWPSTIRRTVSETLIFIIPSRMIYIMEHLVHRFGRLPYHGPMFRIEDFGNPYAKAEAVNRIFGRAKSPVTSVMRKARTLSGLDNVFRPYEEVGPPGLGNWDNSCYQNSVLQGFASLPAFRAFLSRNFASMDSKHSHPPTHEALIGFLGGLNDLFSSSKILWTPSVLKSMDSWQQQDAQEYFSRVLDEVEKETIQHYKSLGSKPGLENLRKRKFEDYAREPQQTPTPGKDDDIVFEQLQKHMSQSSSAGLAGKISTQAPLVESSRLQSRDILPSNPLDGLLAQGLECMTCEFTEGLTFTQFNCLTVNLGDGGGCQIEALLEEYTAPEEIEGVECTQCTKLANASTEPIEESQVSETKTVVQSSNPKSRPKPVLRTKSKQITVGRLPQDLVIHINRSIFDMYGNQRKNTSIVRFPMHLDFLTRWCSPIDVDVESEKLIQRTYALKCVVTHYGRHENGHYIAYGKREKDWYCFNDEIVTPVEVEEVLRAGNVFMLFYEAIEECLLPSTNKPGETEQETAATIAEPEVDQDGSNGEQSESESTTVSSSPVASPMEMNMAEARVQVTELQLPTMRTATPSTSVQHQIDRPISPSIISAV